MSKLLNDIKNKLCIDIGGTNISASVLKSSMTIDQLNNANYTSIKTQGWLNKTLPQFITHKKFEKLINESEEPIDEISICGPFEIDDSGNRIISNHYYVENHGVPTNLTQIISDNIGKPVTIKNDAVAWAEGIFRYHKLNNDNIKLPALTFCLGTGVGMSIAYERDEIIGYDLSAQLKGSDFKKLTDVSNYKPVWGKDPTAGKVHIILGYNFFVWVRKQKKDWSYERIQKEYTKRFIALLHDLHYHINFEYSKVKTILVCGGSAEYISQLILNESNEEYITNKKFVLMHEVVLNSEKIPLLGNL